MFQHVLLRVSSCVGRGPVVTEWGRAWPKVGPEQEAAGDTEVLKGMRGCRDASEEMRLQARERLKSDN